MGTSYIHQPWYKIFFFFFLHSQEKLLLHLYNFCLSEWFKIDFVILGYSFIKLIQNLERGTEHFPFKVKKLITFNIDNIPVLIG